MQQSTESTEGLRTDSGAHPSERSLAEELDALYARVRGQVGEADLKHLRRVNAYSKAIEARGQELLAAPKSWAEWRRGVLLRALHLTLEFSELGHLIMHGGYDHLAGVGDLHSERFEWALAVDPVQWRTMHHLNHHPKTGIVGQDHDMGFSAGRFFAEQDWQAHHLLQQSLLSVFVLSPLVFASYTASSAERVRPTGKSGWQIFTDSTERLRAHLVRELWRDGLRTGSAGARRALGNLLSQVLGYDLVGMMLIIEHHAPNVEVFADPGPAESRDAYYSRQILATTNFTPWKEFEDRCVKVLEDEVPFDGRPDFEVFYGGLDTHIEHHLFPDLPGNRLRDIAPEVEKICRRHGLPYNTMPIREAVPASFGRLFDNRLPLGEGEKPASLLSRPGAMFRRITDGFRYRNSNPQRYFRRAQPHRGFARVLNRQVLAGGEVLSLRLGRPKGWERLSWKAGAYISVEVEVDGRPEVRCYSLLEQAPGCDLEIAIRRVRDGKVSNALFEQAVVGSHITVLGKPQEGGLANDSSSEGALYIAGGVGITPILARLRDAQCRRETNATLLYFNRSRKSTVFLEELRSMPGLSLHCYFDDEGAQRLNAEMLEQHGAGGARVFACAPEGLLASLEAMAPGVGIGELFLERFAADAPAFEETGRVHRLRFLRSGVEVEADEGLSLLEVGRRAGVALPSGCERGMCRACACTRVKGTSEEDGGVQSEGAARITLCNSFARGDLELDA